MANALYRTQHDLGLEGTVEWLAGWLGNGDDFTVEAISISCPDSAYLSKADAEQLNGLTSNNQSELHCYLKFVAMKWLEKHSAYPGTIASEVKCYFPDKDLCRGIKSFDAFGSKIDIRSAHILYDNDNCIGFPLSYGTNIRLDLHSFDIAVEVGGTQPINLLRTLFDGLADRSVWIPYPKGTQPNTFGCCSGGLGTVRAYAVHLNSVPRVRRKRTPEMNRRGPHPYPLTQWAFAEWYIRQHGEEAPARAEMQSKQLQRSGDIHGATNWRSMATYIASMLADAQWGKSGRGAATPIQNNVVLRDVVE